jgi:hypothetical protein
VVPNGFTATGLRLVLKGDHLQQQTLDGKKWGTTRAWKDTPIKSFRKAAANGHLVRLQKTRSNHTIIGWVLLQGLSEKGHPDVVVTKASLLLVGCAHMTKQQYIAEYCMVTGANGVSEIADEVVMIYFDRIWDRGGRCILPRSA